MSLSHRHATAQNLVDYFFFLFSIFGSFFYHFMCMFWAFMTIFTCLINCDGANKSTFRMYDNWPLFTPNAFHSANDWNTLHSSAAICSALKPLNALHCPDKTVGAWEHEEDPGGGAQEDPGGRPQGEHLPHKVSSSLESCSLPMFSLPFLFMVFFFGEEFIKLKMKIPHKGNPLTFQGSV